MSYLILTLLKTTPFQRCKFWSGHKLLNPTANAIIRSDQICLNTDPAIFVYNDDIELSHDLVHVSSLMKRQTKFESMIYNNYFRDVSTNNHKTLLVVRSWYRIEPEMKRLDIINVCEKVNDTDECETTKKYYKGMHHFHVYPKFHDNEDFIKNLQLSSLFSFEKESN